MMDDQLSCGCWTGAGGQLTVCCEQHTPPRTTAADYMSMLGYIVEYTPWKKWVGEEWVTGWYWYR